MTREWKPGDVAMVTWHRHNRPDEDYVGVRTKSGDWLVDGMSIDGDSGWTNPRPLVVIDPEDLATISALADAYWQVRRQDTTRLHALREALRSLVEPPKPAEVYEGYPVRAYVRYRSENGFAVAWAERLVDDPEAPRDNIFDRTTKEPISEAEAQAMADVLLEQVTP